MDEATHKWLQMTGTDWDQFFICLHEKRLNKKTLEFQRKGLQLNKDVFGRPQKLTVLLDKEDGPSSLIDWLHIILYSLSFEPAVLKIPENRVNIFSITGKVNLPISVLGMAGKNYLSLAKSNYQSKAWAPPLTKDKMASLKEALEALDADLELALNWSSIVNMHKKQILSFYDQDCHAKHTFTDPPIDEDSCLQTFKKELILSYRNYVIGQAKYLEDEAGEMNREHKLREYRCSAFLKLINQYVIEYPENEAYHKLKSSLQHQLFSQIKEVMQQVKMKASKGDSIKHLLHLLDNALSDFRHESHYEFLGREDGEQLLKNMELLKKDYQEIVDKIDTHLRSIAVQFVPSFDQDSHNRMITLIRQASNAIQSLGAFRRRKEVGKRALAKHFISKEAIDTVHDTALYARVEYFDKMIPNHIDKLLFDQKEGLLWLTYPRARRELIAALFEKHIDDEVNYKKPNVLLRLLGIKISKSHYSLLQQLQKLHINTYLEDIKIATHNELDILRRKILNDPLLEPLPKCQFKQKDEGFSLDEQIDILINCLEDCVEKSQDNQAEEELPKLFSKRSSPEVDITLGLYKELKTDLKQDNQYQETSLVLYEAKNEPGEIKNYINQIEHHELLQQGLETEPDPIERIMIVDHVFNTMLEGKSLKLRFLQHKKVEQFSTTQQHAIKVLQEIKIKSLVQAWHQKARTMGKMDGEIGLPDSLSKLQKNDIYMDLLYPAKKSPLLNCEIYPGRIKRLQWYLNNMINVLNAMPEH